MELEIVEFLDGDNLKIGQVVNRSAGRIQVRDQNGKEHSLNHRQVLLVHDRKVEVDSFPDFSESYLEKVKDLSREIDLELLWYSLIDKGKEELNPAEAADIYFGGSESINQSAIFRAASGDNILFRKKGLHLGIRTEEQVAEQRHLERRKQEREQLILSFSNWVSGTLENQDEKRKIDLQPEFVPFLTSLEQTLTNREYRPESWLQALLDLHSNPLQSRTEIIVRVLVESGRLPVDTDPFLLDSGLPLEFNETALLEAKKICGLPEPVPTQQFHEPIFSIDDEETEEVDDAISIQKTGEGFQVGIHVADLATLIPGGTALDLDALSRCSSLYLPHRQIRMLPENISCQRASLLEEHVRPVLSCTILLNTDMEIMEWSFSRRNLKIDRNFTYDQADSIIESRADLRQITPASADSLTLLRIFTERLATDRSANHALNINRPEQKIKVDKNKVLIEQLNPESPSRQLVSELMILYNFLAAKFAVQNRIPLIFRTQKKPGMEIPALPEKGYDNYKSFVVFSSIEAGILATEPSSHFGLGLDCYAQVSSPIRRYSDMINQRQICSILDEKNPPFSEERLKSLIAELAPAEKSRRSLERKINRLFTLRFLFQEKKKDYEIVILQPLKGGYLVETSQECYRGILNTTEKLEPGTIRAAVIDKIDPENDLLQFRTG